MSIVIPLDGPTSSGKNSVGHLLSKKLGFQFIDSGSIFRVGTIRALGQNLDLEDEEKLQKLFKSLKIEFKTVKGEVRIFENGNDLTDDLHHHDISGAVHIVAKHKLVRIITKQIQREVSQKQNTVLAGRDIGSVIFPEAKLKFFLTASPQVRAKRRFTQLKLKHPKITLKEVSDSMQKRDHADSTRIESPLVIPKGAVVIDNTYLTVEQTVDQMLEEFKKVYSEFK